MSLLWMSFVRDVRLLWEDGAALARMVRRDRCAFGNFMQRLIETRTDQDGDETDAGCLVS